MHKFLYILMFTTCTTILMAADDNPSPSIFPSLIKKKHFSEADLNASPIVAEAREETQILEIIKPLVTLNQESSILKINAQGYAGANNDSAAILTNAQITALLTAQEEERLKGDINTTMHTMINLQDISGALYDSARCLLIPNSFMETVVKSLLKSGNIVASRISYSPQSVEGTEAKPTTMAKYALYEVSPIITKLLEKYVVVKNSFQRVIDHFQLIPLTYVTAQEILKRDNILTQDFTEIEKSSSYKLPLSFGVRYHTSAENVASNEFALKAYFIKNIKESMKSLGIIKPAKSKKKKHTKPISPQEQVATSSE